MYYIPWPSISKAHYNTSVILIGEISYHKGLENLSVLQLMIFLMNVRLVLGQWKSPSSLLWLSKPEDMSKLTDESIAAGIK